MHESSYHKNIQTGSEASYANKKRLMRGYKIIANTKNTTNSPYMIPMLMKEL